MNILARGVVRLVHIYQRFVSPALSPRCRYVPTCSQYAIEAVERFGVVRGLSLAAWRVLRCNHWSKGGYDEVPEQFRLRRHTEVAA